MLLSVFEDEIKDKELKQLILERQKIMKRIIEFEDVYILKRENPKKSESNDFRPDLVWRVDIQSLEVYNKVIDRKTRDKHGVGIDLI